MAHKCNVKNEFKRISKSGRLSYYPERKSFSFEKRSRSGSLAFKCKAKEIRKGEKKWAYVVKALVKIYPPSQPQ
jgi:hypothetical protein